MAAEQLPVFKKPKRERTRFSLQFEVSLEESSRLEALKARLKQCKSRWQVESNTEWLERVLDVVEMMQSSPASPMSQPSSPAPSPFLAPFTPPQSRYFSPSFSTGSSPIPSPTHLALSLLLWPYLRHQANNVWRYTLQLRKMTAATSWPLQQLFAGY